MTPQPLNVGRALLLLVLMFAGHLYGDSVLLDGVDDHVAVGHDPALALNEFTIETWFKRATGGTTVLVNSTKSYPLISRGNAANFFLGTDMAGHLHGEVVDQVLGRISVLAPIATVIGEWHHGALTCDGTRLRLYLDGSEVAEKAVSGPVSTSPEGTRIGQITYQGSAFGSWSGWIDETRIWNRALSPTEIGINRWEGITFTTGLVARWGFEQTGNPTLLSDGANVIAVTLTNGASLAMESAPLAGLAPTASIAMPNTTLNVTVGTSLNVSAAASDTDDAVVKVEFYANHEKIGEDNSAPYELTWTPMKTGMHVLRAVAEDSSGHRNGGGAGVLVGTMPTLGREAIYFDGESAYADAGNSAQLDLPVFTVETRFYMDGDGKPAAVGIEARPTVALVSRGSTAFDTNYFLGVRVGPDVLVGGFGAHKPMLIGQSAITRGIWHHAALSFDGETLRLYLDGVLEAEERRVNLPVPGTPRRTTLAAMSTSNYGNAPTMGGIFCGALDEVRIWDHSRALGAIAHGRRAKIQTAPGLISRWSMDGTSSGTLLATGNAPVDATVVSRTTDSGSETVSGIVPTANVVSPGGEITIERNATLVLEAGAQDADGNVERVEFWTESGKLGEDLTEPYTFIWSAAPIGKHMLSAVAIDTDGSAGSSLPVPIHVTAPVGTGALYFDGVGDDALSATNVPSGGKFTVEGWFRREGVAQSDFLTYRSDTIGETILGLSAYAGHKVLLGVRTGDQKVIAVFQTPTDLLKLESAVSLEVGRWYHGAMTYDGERLRVYLDGVPLMNGPLANAIPSSLAFNVYAAGGSDSTRSNFKGLIDELRLWDYDRSEAEIAGAFQQQFTNAPGLLSAWTFSEGVGETSNGTGANPTVFSFVNSNATWTIGLAPTTTLAPTVTITAPAAGSTWPVMAPFPVEVDANDPNGSVQRVELYLDSAKVGEDSTAPYEFEVTGQAIGTKYLRAVAIDNSGLANTTRVALQLSAPTGLGGLYFDGVDDHVRMQENASPAIEQFTVEGWIKRDGSGVEIAGTPMMVPIIWRGTATQITYALGFQATSGKPVAATTRVNGNTTANLVGNTAIPIGEWHHLAMTFDGYMLRLFVDGTLDASLITPGNPVLFSHLWLGARGPEWAPSGAFHGYLDEVRVWNHARGEAAIAADRWKSLFNDPTLIHRWGMNEGAGTEVSTEGSTPITGTISGATWTVGRPNGTGNTPSPVLSVNQTPRAGESALLTAVLEPEAALELAEFYANGIRIGQTATAPWAQPFTPTSPGRYVITAVTTVGGVRGASNDLVLDVLPSAGTGAVYLDGIDDYIELPSREELSLPRFTMEAWFRCDGPGRVATSIGTGTAVPLLTSATYGYMQVGLDAVSGLLRLSYAGTGRSASTPIAFGSWFHVAVTVDSGNAKLFLNGTEEASFTYPTPSPTFSSVVTFANSAFGTRLSSDGTQQGAFHGLLDEVRIWSVIRTPEQIAADRLKEIQDAPGLVGRWSCDEESGAIAMDSTAQRLHGELINGATWTAGHSLVKNSPPSAILQMPSPNATVTAPVNLAAMVDGEPAEGLTANFYGREIPRETGDFTVALIPSAANYTTSLNGGSPATLNAMMDWIVDNRIARNIVFVGQYGQLASENGPTGWAEAGQAFAKLEDPLNTGLSAGIPYGITPPMFGGFYYDQQFNSSRNYSRSWYGLGNRRSSVVFFRAGGLDMASVQFAGELFDTEWLRKLLQTHPQRRFIIMSNAQSSFSTISQTVRTFPNVALLIDGYPSGEGRENVQNATYAYQHIWGNYADRPNGGDAWMRLLTFMPKAGRIRVQTYSPTRNEFETDRNSDFTVRWNSLLAARPSELIGTSSHNPGNTASALWSETVAARRYEWHATVSDGVNTVASTSREFRTAAVGAATPPTVSLLSPTGNQTVRIPAVLAITAAASSADDAIERVDLLVNGLALESDEAAPYSYFWSPGAPGTYQVAVAAVDRRGLRTESSPISVVVNPSTNVTLIPAISSPGANSFLYDSGLMPIEATINTTATVTEVDFYIDGVVIGTDATAPFSYDWHYSGTGTRVLQVLARTATGESATSAFVPVNLGPLLAPTATRLPYLQLPTPNAVTVCWRSAQTHPGRVWYGTQPGSLTLFADELSPTTEHGVRVTGLQPNTRYYYGVGSQHTIASGNDVITYFTTPPLIGRARNTRIWALGSFGAGNPGQTNTRDAYYSYTISRDTDLFLTLGDHAFSAGLDAEFQGNFFNKYDRVLRRAFTWPTIGNRDVANLTVPNPNHPYFAIFRLPADGECGGVSSGSERYYSFDYANIHFVCLDSMTTDRTPSGPMATWLRNDLAATTARWKIAYWHHSPYSKGGADSDTVTQSVEMRTNIVPILEEFGVDLVLSAESHNYERSWLFSDHYGGSSTFTDAMKRSLALGRPTASDGHYSKDPSVPLMQQGTVYVVAGNGAALASSASSPLNHPAMAINLRALGSLVIDINGTRMDVRMIPTDGVSTDNFTMVKPYSGADEDGDQLPDDFETEFGLARSDPSDGGKDADGDGFTNLQEYLVGTHPLDRSSRLAVRVTRSSTGPCSIFFETLSTIFYTVERCDSLGAGDWVPVAPETRGSGFQTMVTDTTAAGVPTRFYRVRVKR